MTRKFWKRTEPLDHTEPDRTEPDHAEPDHAELARLLPAPSAPRMPLDRQLLFEEHLLNEIRTHDPAPAPAPAPKAAKRPVRRTLLIAVPVTAAVLTAVVAVGTLTSGIDRPRAAASVEAPVVPVEEGSALQLVSTVQQLAAAVSTQQIPVPKPGQFIYVKSKVSYLSFSHNGDTDEHRTWVQPLHQREVWKSPDALKGWLDEPGYQDEGGITLDSDGPHSKPENGQDIPGEPRRLSYNWLKTQPTDPDPLLKSIYTTVSGPRDRDQQAFETIKEIINEQLVPAPSAAALYRAAANIPGVVVVQNSQDAVGRTGLALARLDEQSGERLELVFDRTSFTYLGSRGVQIRQVGSIKPGTVTERTAVLERAVVDARKERPTTGGTA
ncbi:CU044_5270 family protein [Kitasatospora sp. NBC_01560]|uniref:CU044_5270 family protein n=1 Tax=Kitasatospora sp. NBC_01560 TaxID=2975965 RepID=UPI00386BBBB0